MSMVGYAKCVAPVGSGFRSSVQDCFCFHDTFSAHAAHGMAQKRAARCGGKVAMWFGHLVGYDLRQQYASLETVGQGIGEWDGEAVEAAAS